MVNLRLKNIFQQRLEKKEMLIFHSVFGFVLGTQQCSTLP